MAINLRALLVESRLDQLYAEMKEHIRCYKIAKAANNEWQMQDCMKKIKLLAPEIKREKAKGPEELDKDAFLRHHYTGHISSTAYSKYEDEKGVEWLGLKSKYPVLLHKGNYGGHEIEFRQTGEKNRYCRHDAKGDIVYDPKGECEFMTDDEIKAENLPLYDESIVAFAGDKPIGWASNEFGAVGVWVVKNYQKLGIGTDLLDMHMQLRPRMASGKGKIGQATSAGIALMAAYHRKMTKKHGVGWFQKLRGNITEIMDPAKKTELKKYGAMAKQAASTLLGKAGLEDPQFFILRIKEMKDEDWIASYRTHTVMSGRPIIWINYHLPEMIQQYDPGENIVRVMTDNILHEWWHAICDAFRAYQFRSVPLGTKVSFQPDEDEERDAELFIAFCGGDTWGDVSSKKARYFENAIQEFNGLWR